MAWGDELFSSLISNLQPLQFLCKFEIAMTRIVIDKKKYVLVPEREYNALQKKAALKTKPEKLLSMEEARSHSKKLIRKWASEK
jgi:hypothetical protein